MTKNNDGDVNSNLLGTILNVINEKQDYNINELVGLLALSNLLGIITFLNSQGLNLETNVATPQSSVSDIKKLASTVLGDKNINPTMLLNLLKNFSPEKKQTDKSQQKLTKEENEKS